MNVHTIATWVQVLARALDASGHSSAAVLGRVGIEAAGLHDANRRIPLERMNLLWREVERVTGDRGFGLRLAAHCFATDFHGLMFAMQSSLTLAEALERAVRFSHIVSTSADLRLQHDGEACLLLFGSAPGVHTEQMATEAHIACGLHFSRQSWGDSGFIRGVHLRRPPPLDALRWEAMLGCPVRFGATCNAIEYAAECLGAPLRTGNSELAQSLDQVMNDYLLRLRRDDLPQQVRKVIVRLLPHGDVPQTVVAQELGMSVRNLHRHLLKHGASFKDLLDHTRRQLAFDSCASRTARSMKCATGWASTSRAASTAPSAAGPGRRRASGGSRRCFHLRPCLRASARPRPRSWLWPFSPDAVQPRFSSPSVFTQMTKTVCLESAPKVARPAPLSGRGG